MNKIFIPIVLILFLVNLAQAQSTRVFTVGAEGLYVIAANEVPESFNFDVSAMHFKSAAIMNQYCETTSSFVVKFTPDFEHQYIHVQIFNDKIPNGEKWGVKDWNEFFLTYQPKWYTYFTSINN